MKVHEFRGNLVQGIYEHIYQRLDDNFDYFRFGFDGVDRSNQINGLQHAQYLDFVLANIDAFYTVYFLLSDTASRNLFVQLIKYRFLGHPHIRIKEEMTWTTVKAMYDKGASYDVGPSSIEFKGLFGGIRHHEKVPVEQGEIALDAWSVNVAYGLGSGRHRQYYFEREGVCIRPEKGDYVIDGGACFGDTAIFFVSSVGASGKVFAFEPLPAHVEVVKLNISQNAMNDRVMITPAGIGEVSNHVAGIDEKLSSVASPGFSLIGREDQVPIISIDEFVESNGVEKINFIKMDIEGFELGALKGAVKTIGKHKPKLAISLYHKPQDFFEIPIFLKTHFPFYRLYLDHYTIFGEETVLYAIAD
jgi:FkbM family methyltransferase